MHALKIMNYILSPRIRFIFGDDISSPAFMILARNGMKTPTISPVLIFNYVT